MSTLIIEFPELKEIVEAHFLGVKAPKTCEGIKEALKSEVITTGKHAMYTGREISVQLPIDSDDKTLLRNPAPENLTCFPLPGDILFTYMPKHAFGGITQEVFDIGIFYGRDARTFFPMGWLPGNLCAQVKDPEEQKKLFRIGQYINENGKQEIKFYLK